MAERLGISLATFERWLRRHPDLRAAVHEARDEADAAVVNALRQRALGMVLKEEKAFLDPRTGKITKVTLLKEIPPSEVAAMMWLTNRHPGEWRWRPSVDRGNRDSFAAFADAMRSRVADTLEGEVVPPERRLLMKAEPIACQGTDAEKHPAEAAGSTAELQQTRDPLVRGSGGGES